MQNPRTIFLDFVQLDKQVVSLENAILNHQIQLKKLYTKQEDADRDHHENHLKWYYTIHRVHELESQAQSLQAIINAALTKLASVTQYKEYEGLQKKITEIRIDQAAVEAELVEAWVIRDEQDAYYKNYESEYKNNNALRAIEIQAEQEVLNQLLNDIVSVKSKRDALRITVSEKLLQWYDRMRAQISEPVVLAVHNMCQGCYNQIPDKDMMRLQRGGFILCKACYRCMYVADSLVDTQQYIDEIQQ